MISNSLADKPHAVCIPCAAQSHMKSMLKLAKLLHGKGFHITFVNTEFNHQRLLKSRGPDAMDGLPDFRFESMPDGLPPSNENATQDAVALCEASKNLLAPFNDLLHKLNDSASSNVPPVTCIVSDGFMPVTIDAAEMRQIPIALFFTSSACSFMGYKHFQALQEKGLTPLKDESFLTNGYLDKVVDWIPGMRGIRLRDLPSFIRTTDPDDFFFKYCVECVGRASKGSAVIFNTFDVLEQEVLNALYPMFPRVYTIEVECLHWLDSNKPRSVIYVNFGSIATVTKEQLVEFGMGLAESGHPFLWIIRPDMVAGDSAILPPEFTEESKERSFICSWCPQEEVLNHPSIGGFLTHSGWGSTIESISSGVPMLCWPFAGDQLTNCRYTCSEWGIGMEIESNVKRQKVKKLVTELMEGEKGEKMKKKAMEWRKLAEEASGPSGSSSMNLDKLVKECTLTCMILKNQCQLDIIGGIIHQTTSTSPPHLNGVVKSTRWDCRLQPRRGVKF
ncbi:7-deoxyloganetin glucosyltransferase [Salix suchowensis]|nr:7-deoxyloganetin glucosyltransferase [Salix suchowensis]